MTRYMLVSKSRLLPLEKRVPLTFTLTQHGSKDSFLQLRNDSYIDCSGLFYRTNENEPWKQYKFNSNSPLGERITFTNIGDYVQFKNINSTWSLSDKQFIYFVIERTNNCLFDVSGSVQSLLNYSRFCPDYCFYNLFNSFNLQTAPSLDAEYIGKYSYANMFANCSYLTTPPKLSVKKLSEYCYNRMFEGCTSLTTAPELPATTLTKNCYSSMFNACTSLTQTPELPALKLANSCYSYMFAGCSKLINAPDLLATEIPPSAYYYMFSNCTKLESPAKTPDNYKLLSVNELDSETAYNMSYMYSKCSSLKTTPTFPNTKLTNSCYRAMFNECSSLEIVPELPATTLAKDCYYGLFQKCSNIDIITDNYTLPALHVPFEGYYSMFNGCTELSKTPVISAETIDDRSLSYLFRDCKSLTQIPELKATQIGVKSYNRLLAGCTGLSGTITLPATEIATDGYNQLLNGCSNITGINVSFISWTDNQGNSFTTDWVKDIAASGEFICPSGLPILTGDNRIPADWTVVQKMD